MTVAAPVGSIQNSYIASFSSYRFHKLKCSRAHLTTCLPDQQGDDITHLAFYS